MFPMIRAARVLAIIGLALYYGESSPRAQGADHPPVLLSWVTPESSGSGCPDAAYVLAEVRRYVGTGTVVARAPILASAMIRAGEAGGFQLTLKTTDGETSGERSFHDQSCRALADAAVVVLAWMVAPGAMATRSLPPPPQSPAAPSVSPAPTKPVPPSTLKRVGPTPYLGLGATADVGTLADPALGVEGRLGVAVNRLRIEARAAYWPTRRKTVAPLANGDVPGATFTLLEAGLQACLEAFPAASRSRFGLALCADPEIDALNGAGFGVTVPAKASKTWLSFSAAIEGRVAIASRVRLFLRLAGVVPTEREHFALRGVGEIYRPTPVGGRGTLGFELEL